MTSSVSLQLQHTHRHCGRRSTRFVVCSALPKTINSLKIRVLNSSKVLMDQPTASKACQKANNLEKDLPHIHSLAISCPDDEPDHTTSTMIIPKTTITYLQPEVLLNIFQHLDGQGMHDIDPAIFKAAQVYHLWKCIIFEILFAVNLDEGLTLGFEHYLDGRISELHEQSLFKARSHQDIEWRENKELECISTKLDELTTLSLAHRPSPSRRRGLVPKSGNTVQNLGDIIGRYKGNRKVFCKESEAQRAAFTKMTQTIFSFQDSWNGRRKWTHVGRGDWVWAEIVASRIESDLCEKSSDGLLVGTGLGSES